MIEGGGGSLITMSSVNAIWSIGEFGDSAAKAGLIQFTKNIAVTYGPQGIRANVICPGTIATESGAAYRDQKAGGKEKLLKWYPLRRLGLPEDVRGWRLSRVRRIGLRHGNHHGRRRRADRRQPALR